MCWELGDGQRNGRKWGGKIDERKRKREVKDDGK